MATTARLTVRVGSTRGGSTLQISSSGRYVSMPTYGVNIHLPGQPIQTTLNEKAFWTGVLVAVQAQIAAM